MDKEILIDLQDCYIKDLEYQLKDRESILKFAENNESFILSILTDEIINLEKNKKNDQNYIKTILEDKNDAQCLNDFLASLFIMSFILNLILGIIAFV